MVEGQTSVLRVYDNGEPLWKTNRGDNEQRRPSAPSAIDDPRCDIGFGAGDDEDTPLPFADETTAAVVEPVAKPSRIWSRAADRRPLTFIEEAAERAFGRKPRKVKVSAGPSEVARAPADPLPSGLGLPVVPAADEGQQEDIEAIPRAIPVSLSDRDFDSEPHAAKSGDGSDASDDDGPDPAAELDGAQQTVREAVQPTPLPTEEISDQEPLLPIDVCVCRQRRR